MYEKQQRRLHDELDFVGLRAQATAVAVLQMCIELRRAGVFDDDAITRIKEAIACEIAVSRPRSSYQVEYDHAMQRLDALFLGEAAMRPAKPEIEQPPTSAV